MFLSSVLLKCQMSLQHHRALPRLPHPLHPPLRVSSAARVRKATAAQAPTLRRRGRTVWQSCRSRCVQQHVCKHMFTHRLFAALMPFYLFIFFDLSAKSCSWAAHRTLPGPHHQTQEEERQEGQKEEEKGWEREAPEDRGGCDTCQAAQDPENDQNSKI